jgi:hypothetical protein
VEGLNKQQKALSERSIDKFIIDNKMCSTKFKPIAKNTKESTNSDLRRKVDDHKCQVRKSKPEQKGVAKKSATKKPKEHAEIIYKPRSYTTSKYDIIQKNSMTSYNFFRQNV